MAEEDSGQKERCELHHVNGIEAWCTREKCIYWRLVEAQDEELGNINGCGLRFFKVIDDLKPETARWLLSIKKQLEGSAPEIEKARINFKRREK